MPPARIVVGLLEMTRDVGTRFTQVGMVLVRVGVSRIERHRTRGGEGFGRSGCGCGWIDSLRKTCAGFRRGGLGFVRVDGAPACYSRPGEADADPW